MPVATLVLITELYIKQLLLFRERIVVVVGEVVALRLTVAVSYRSVCLVTILETYSSKDAYEKHIASAHFQKYKKGTLHMVKSLQLCDQTALNPANKINNYIDQ